MSQALHIFRKDVRYLRLQIGLFLLLTALFALPTAGPLAQAVVVILIIGAINLTSRAIHGEPIPGTGQFWITRPYRWQSLLTAKLLFLLICIDVPVGVARLAKLAMEGFPVGYSLPSLLWTQLLLFAALLPVAALAALTSGIMEFSVGMLGLAVAYLIVTFVVPFAVRIVHIWPVSVEWLQEGAVFMVIAAIAVAVLFWQYRYRRTGFSRILTAGGALAAAAIYIGIPASAGVTIETWLSRQTYQAVQIAPDPNRKIALPWRTAQDEGSGKIRVPFAMTLENVPAGDEVAVDELEVTLDSLDGSRWEGTANVVGAPGVNGRAPVSGSIAIPLSFHIVNTPVKIRGSLYFTLFGEGESRTIPLTTRPAIVQDGLQCFNGFNSQSRTKSAGDRDHPPMDYTEDFSSYFCRGFFGWPSRLVYARTGDMESAFTHLVSYSPFPSGLDLDSAEARYTSLITQRSTMSAPIRDITIVTKRPLAHLHRSFDFAWEFQMPVPPGIGMQAMPRHR